MNSMGTITFATQAFVTLFVIMDPPGATPIFLGLVGDKIATRASAFSVAGSSCFTLCYC